MQRNKPLPAYRLLCAAAIMAAAACSVQAEYVFREPLEAGVFAAIRGGCVLFLECNPPPGNAAQPLLERYLAKSGDWRLYRDRIAVAIPFAKLNSKAQRQVLEAIFPLDYVDASGWWHTVRFAGSESSESLASFAEWTTGSSETVPRIVTHAANRTIREPLNRGDCVLIPQPFLLPVMKAHSPRPTPPPPPLAPASADESEWVAQATAPALLNGDVSPASSGLLEYGEDSQGPYALYLLRPGESLYSAVVVRFTDYRENADIHQACEIIQKRSGIRNVHRMSAGQRVIIPLEMLSDQYQPAGSSQRRAYEEIREEAKRLKADRVGSKDLEGVVVILDPGHGGRDQGAAIARLGLYEDEINYDIVCRIKEILETRTRARVHVTVLDPAQEYSVSSATRFVHDTREVVLTTPNYLNDDAKVSANLRWYLANDIFHRERKNGVNERKIIFASIHCDALFNDSLRGAMVYVPGAPYRRDTERPAGVIYKRFEEVRRSPAAGSTHAQRTRDEALSRNFAVALLNAMRNNDPPLKVHDAGDPIRNVIRQSGGKAYLPAVLRNSTAPTKVLVEVANMTNPMDQKHLANPQWRQWFAEAFVNALKAHYED